MKKSWTERFASLPNEELEKIALLRLIETTSGVIQHAFRDKRKEALSAEETKTAMQFSTRCMKNMCIPFGDKEVCLNDEAIEICSEVRKLYISGVKEHNQIDFFEFLHASEASLRVVGYERLEKAKFKIFSEVYDIPPHTLDWGLAYINNFLGNTSNGSRQTY